MFMLALRAVVLDGRVFQEVKDRQEAMFSALGIVAVAGVALGLGVWIEPGGRDSVGFDQDEALNLLFGISTIVSGWFIWTGFAWLLGARLFQGDAGFRAIMRSVGICYSPMWLAALAPWVELLLVVGGVWVLVAIVNALRNTLGIAWWQSVIAAIFGWLWGLVLMVSLYLGSQTLPVS